MFRRLSALVLALLAFAILALSAAGWFYLTKPGHPGGKDPATVKLKEERNALGDFSDQALAALEVKQRDAKSRLPAQAEVAKFIDDMKANWTVQSLGRVDAKYVGTRRYMLTNRNQRFRGGNDRQWSDVVTAIKSIDEHPGFVIQSVVISSSASQGITYGQVVVTMAVGTRDDTVGAPPAVTPVAAADLTDKR